jgi:hypothetical protein
MKAALTASAPVCVHSCVRVKPAETIEADALSKAETANKSLARIAIDETKY